MGLKKLWVRIQIRLAAEKFFRCGMEFTREWPKQPIEVDEATAERLEQEQMLEVTYTDPHPKASETESEGVERTTPTGHASDAPVTGAPDAPNTDDEHDAGADLPQGSGVDSGGSVTGSGSDKSAAADVKTAPEDLAERITAISVAAVQLDAANASLWTAGGSPKTEALTAITGWPVSAADRDAAWASALAEKGC